MNIRSNPDKTLPAVTTGPLPSSRKIFASPDAAPDLRVPLREIMLSEGAGEPNLPVYDTSGPYTDPAVTIDVNAGLARNRNAWVLERGGVEEYAGRKIKPEDNGNVSTEKAARAFSAYHQPLRGLDGHKITQLEFARAGIITKEMIYVAERENSAASSSSSARKRRSPTAKALAPPCPPSSPRSSCAPRSRAAAPSSPATSTTPSSSR